MAKKDWSLVFFTTVTQASIGITLCFATLNFGGVASWQNGPSLYNPVLLALLLVAIATLVSLAHLGTPTNAPRALNNLAGSWLSREILALGLHSAALAVTFIVGRVYGTAPAHNLVLALSAVMGVLLLWSMTRVYMIVTIPPWNTCHTRLGFTTTTLSLGAGILMAGQFSHRIDFSDMAVGVLLGLLCTVLLAELVSATRYQSTLEKMDGGIDKPVYGQGAFYRRYLARLVTLCAAIISMVILALLVVYGSKIPAAWAWLVLTLTLAQEITGRNLFYAAYFRAGV